MQILVSILQIIGIIFLVMLVIGFAARRAIQGRATRRANKTARLRVEPPASQDDAGNRADERAGSGNGGDRPRGA